MTKFSIRLVGEDSPRAFEAAGENETVETLARHLLETGYMLGRMKTSDRVPEPEEVAILAGQVKWITLAPVRQAR
jgi:hypothetical protein